MKCECEKCRGAGLVPCADCDGSGQVPISIEVAKLDPEHKNFDELTALQADAKRARRSMAVLIEMKPAFSDTYRDQLALTLRELNYKADQL